MHSDESEMKHAAGFVFYEIEQFRWAMKNIPNEWRCGTSGILREEDAVVEVALLHARALREFFFRRRTSISRTSNWWSDVLAEDFFDDPSQWKIPTMTFLGDKNNKDRLDRSLSHLTYHRIEYQVKNQKRWDFSAMSQDIEESYSKFLDLLPAGRQAWFADSQFAEWEP